MWAKIIKFKEADHDQFLHLNFGLDLAHVLPQLGAHCFEKMFGIARVEWCLESSHLILIREQIHSVFCSQSLTFG